MAQKLDGMERALNSFVAEYLRRFMTMSWEWVDMDKCRAVLRVMVSGDERPWEVPIVGDDEDRGYDNVLSIDAKQKSVPLSLATLYEYLWMEARG